MLLFAAWNNIGRKQFCLKLIRKPNDVGFGGGLGNRTDDPEILVLPLIGMVHLVSEIAGKRTLVDSNLGVFLAYPVFLGAQAVFLANVILNLVRGNRTP